MPCRSFAATRLSLLVVHIGIFVPSIDVCLLQGSLRLTSGQMMPLASCHREPAAHFHQTFAAARTCPSRILQRNLLDWNRPNELLQPQACTFATHRRRASFIGRILHVGQPQMLRDCAPKTRRLSRHILADVGTERAKPLALHRPIFAKRLTRFQEVTSASTKKSRGIPRRRGLACMHQTINSEHLFDLQQGTL